MASIFDVETNLKLRKRIGEITSNSRRLWGTMSAAQMVLHCQKPMEVAEGTLKISIGIGTLLFGRISKSTFLKSDGFEKNLPTSREFKISIEPDFEIEKEKLLEMVRRFNEFGPAIITNSKHPFFGNMTANEWGILQYLHLDHHLRQFGV